MILDTLFGRQEQRSTRVISGYGIDRDATLKGVFGKGKTTTAGIAVDETEAMSISSFYCGVKLLSWGLGQLPLRLMQRAANGDKTPLTDRPEYRILHDRWNPELTSMRGREIGQTMRIVWGRALIWIETDPFGQLRGLWPMHTRDVKRSRLPDGSVTYNVSHCKDEDDFPRPPFTENILFGSEVIDIPNYNGQSVVDNAREELGEILAAQQFGAGFFAGGSLFAFAYKMRQGRHPKDPDRLRENLRGKHGIQRAIPILEDGDDIVPYGMPLRDAQFLDSREWYPTQIARWLDVQPHKLKDLKHATFSNIYEQRLEWQESLLPHAVMWDQEFTLKLFSVEPTVFVEHMMDAILRANMPDRYEAHRTGITSSFTSPNQVCRRENWNSLGPAGDMLLVPQNMHVVPLTDDARTFYEDLGLVRSREEIERDRTPQPDEAAPPPGEDGAASVEPAQSLSDERHQLALQLGARQALRESLGRALAKEVAQIRDAARHRPNFVDWLDKFYRHRPEKMEALLRPAAETCRMVGIPVDVEEIAFEHCKTARDALLDLTGEVTARQLVARVDEETANWERTLVAQTL